MKIHCRFIILAVILIITALVFAGCKSHRSGYKHEVAMDYIAESLDLNDDQQKELEGIKTDIMAEIQKMREARQSMRATIKEELGKDQVDEAVIKGLVLEHRNQMSTIVDVAVDRLIDFHGSLLPDQKAKLIAKIEKYERWHK